MSVVFLVVAVGVGVVFVVVCFVVVVVFCSDFFINLHLRKTR